jgi:hypothetical protein
MELSPPETETGGSRESVEAWCQADADNEPLNLSDESMPGTQHARTAGFVGPSSEVQWLRAVAFAGKERSHENGIEVITPLGPSYSPCNDQNVNLDYWADSEDIDMDFSVDAYEVPETDVADRLVQHYMLHVHDLFPILSRKVFEDQARKYFTALRKGHALNTTPSWLCILNLIFAIAANHSHMTKASWRASEHDHLIYQARARAFGLSGTTLTNDSDVLQIQALGLLAFYWLSIGQVNR